MVAGLAQRDRHHQKRRHERPSFWASSAMAGGRRGPLAAPLDMLPIGGCSSPFVPNTLCQPGGGGQPLGIAAINHGGKIPRRGLGPVRYWDSANLLLRHPMEDVAHDIRRYAVSGALLQCADGRLRRWRKTPGLLMPIAARRTRSIIDAPTGICPLLLRLSFCKFGARRIRRCAALGRFDRYGDRS